MSKCCEAQEKAERKRGTYAMEKEKIEKQSAESSVGLHQNLGLPTAISTVVGCVIGSGIFFKPQAIYTVTGGAPGLGMLAWVITGLVSIAAALTFAEIAVLFPETGGIPTYLSRVYGPKAVSYTHLDVYKRQPLKSP